MAKVLTRAADAALLLGLHKVAGAKSNHLPDLAPIIPLRLLPAMWTLDL